MDWLKSTRSCISMINVPTDIALIAALCIGQLHLDVAMKTKVMNLIKRPVAMRKHVEKVLLELDIPVEEANKIDTALKWCSTYQFNVEIVSQPADECVIEFATKFTYDSVITLFKDKDIYYLITNRSKFFQVFHCEKKVSSLSLDEALHNIRPLYEERSKSNWFFKNVDVVENLATNAQKEALKDILAYAKCWKDIIQRTEEGCARNDKIRDEKLAIEAQRHISPKLHTHQLNSVHIKHHMSCSECQQQVLQAPGFPKYRKRSAHI